MSPRSIEELPEPYNDFNETSTLLPKAHDTKTRFQLTLSEFYALSIEAAPVIGAYALQNSLQTISVLIVGRVSPEALAVAAFSYMWAMATAWMIAFGGTTAIDTLASASFTGSENKHDLGIILQRAFFVLGIAYVPICIQWAFSEPVFKLLGQEDYIARDSQLFLRALIPGGAGYIAFECLKKYLQAQGIMRAGTYVLLIVSPLNAGLNYLLVYTFDMDLIGSPIATGISYWLSFALLVLYTWRVSGYECWPGWSRRCFDNLLPFARLAFLGTVHIATEFIAFEIVTIVAGQLGTTALAAQSVISTSDLVMNTIPFGLGVATSARVGRYLGAKDSRGAARCANTAACLSMCLGLVVLIILMASKESFAKIFNDDVEVVRLTARVLPFVALFQIADGLNGSAGGALRGMGRQHVGAMVNILSYYVLALPLGIYLALKGGWGLAGLWMGQCIALYLVGGLEWAIVAMSNYDRQVENALSRLEQGEGN